MADRDHTSMTEEKQIPVQFQTDEYRIQRALEAMEKAKDHEALGRAWRLSQGLRDHLEAKYQAGDSQAWSNAKRLHRCLYSCQFQLGQSNADAS
jgi:hypothetical protein